MLQLGKKAAKPLFRQAGLFLSSRAFFPGCAPGLADGKEKKKGFPGKETEKCALPY